MKRVFIQLIMGLFCAGLVSAASASIELDIRDVPEFAAFHMDSGIDYVITLTDNFKKEDVTFEQLNSLHCIMTVNQNNRIEGRILYIYFNGTHSGKVFCDLKKQIDEAPDKYVCVDFCYSDYMIRGDVCYPLPKNCFYGHENLCWIYMGSFVEQQIPENFCSGCTNLQFAVMWDWGNVAHSAFSGVSKDAALYDRKGRKELLSSVHDVKIDEFAEWDYLNFDGTEGDAADSDEFEKAPFSEKLLYQHEEALQRINFDTAFEPEKTVITADNVNDFISPVLKETDPYEVALDFLAGYIAAGMKTDFEQSACRELYDSILDVDGLKICFNRQSLEEYGNRAFFIFGIENYNGSFRDTGSIALENSNGQWNVEIFRTFTVIETVFGHESR